MRSRRWHLWPRSLRWRLTLAVTAVLLLAFAATFAVVYRELDSRLRTRVDADLQRAISAFRATVAPADHVSPTPAALDAAAAAYVTRRPFTASSQLLFAVIPGHAALTNDPETLGLAPRDRDDTAAAARTEARLARALLAAGPGLHTLPAPDVGAARLLVATIPGIGARLGVAEPLSPIDDALDELQRGFAIGGTLTFAGALLIGLLLAAGFTRPLHRIALVAARVDAGDLSPRIDARGPRNETRLLADAFDHMLDRLEEAFARQQAFVSDASHELRTPLTAIRGQLEVLARSERPEAEDVRRVQQVVQAEVDRMTRLTEDLLLLAHTEESGLLRRQATPLQPLLAELLSAAEPTADRRFTLAAQVPGILHADGDRIAQALRNLLGNAIEHTGPGGRIELGARELAGERVAIWVDDDGPGIPAAQRQRVFDRFHRVDPARAGAGTGLGLAIVRAIVSAHGGRVEATQSPLGGARIVIELPGYRVSNY